MKHALFSAIAGSDIKDGVIRGVSVITTGEAKGHGIFIDSKSLQTFLSAAQNRPGGVPVKMDHGTGFYHIVGKLENFRIEGESLRADLQLLKTHEQFSRIVEMANTMAEAFGLSVSSVGSSEEIDGKQYLRCDELNSVDLVDCPAANPTGLFRKLTPVDSTNGGMTDVKSESFFTGLKQWIGVTENTELSSAKAQTVELAKQLGALTAELETLKLSATAKEKEITELKAAQSEFDAKVEKAASAKALQITASQGAPIIPAKPDDVTVDPAKQKISELRGLDKVQACIAAELAAASPNKR